MSRIPVSVVRGLIALMLLSTFAAAASARNVSSCEMPSRLRFSMVPEGSLERDLNSFRPLLDQLESALGIRVEVVRPASYGAVVEGLLGKTIDIARLGPAAYVKARRASKEVEAFATYAAPAGSWQDEGPTYRSLLIVRDRGPRRSIPALKGASLAAADPYSTSGMLAPQALFPRVTEMPLKQYFGWIGFSGGHDAAIRSVIAGRVDAAFVASIHLAGMVRRGEISPDDIRVLWQSPPLPMDPFVFRLNLCPSIRETIAQTFFRFHDTQPQKHLSALAVRRFLKSSDSDFDVIRRLENDGS